MIMANDGTTDHEDQPRKRTKRQRGSRRVTVAGTGPTSADGPEPHIDSVQPGRRQAKNTSDDQNLSERDRWMRDQKPPHY